MLEILTAFRAHNFFAEHKRKKDSTSKNFFKIKICLNTEFHSGKSFSEIRVTNVFIAKNCHGILH